MSTENISAEAQIHPTAIVEEGAKVAAGAQIGPYSVIAAMWKLVRAPLSDLM